MSNTVSYSNREDYIAALEIKARAWEGSYVSLANVAHELTFRHHVCGRRYSPQNATYCWYCH